MSTVKNADKIVAVKDGRVAEQGKHDVLMAAKNVYYKLVLMQTMQDEAEEELKDEKLKDLTESEKGN